MLATRFLLKLLEIFCAELTYVGFLSPEPIFETAGYLVAELAFLLFWPRLGMFKFYTLIFESGDYSLRIFDKWFGA